MSQGDCEERKRKRAGHDEKGKERSAFYFSIVLFSLGCSAGASGEEREHSLRKLTPLFIEYLMQSKLLIKQKRFISIPCKVALLLRREV